MAKTTPKNTTPSFEQAMDELEKILDTIGDENTPLDKSIELYAQAAELINTCNTVLNNAQVKIQEISEKIIQPEYDDEF
ncbi:exodeoxyribonuclease VII small subunit [Ruminococcaceae bacterium OttesenSCG-928-A16]|nr:exodeoxyribonuclease VII small subunit [Ruminococcaceae bacterium OttesenSCG-928-A16]